MSSTKGKRHRSKSSSSSSSSSSDSDSSASIKEYKKKKHHSEEESASSDSSSKRKSEKLRKTHKPSRNTENKDDAHERKKRSGSSDKISHRKNNEVDPTDGHNEDDYKRRHRKDDRPSRTNNDDRHRRNDEDENDRHRRNDNRRRNDRHDDYRGDRERRDDREREGNDYSRDRRRSPERNRRDNRNGRRNRSRSKSYDHSNAKWGRDDNSKSKGNTKQTGDKQKPNFGLSGKLTEETNSYRGVVIKYSEPPEARKPKRRWRLYPFKGEKALQTLYIHRESAYLIGRDRKVVDLPVDHPSCSKQHAALQYRLVPFTRDDGSSGKRVRPYLIDLESANGTFINNKKIDARKYNELLERDVIKFGFSSREYVLLHENSKDEAQDDDVKLEEEEIEVKKEKEKTP